MERRDFLNGVAPDAAIREAARGVADLLGR